MGLWVITVSERKEVREGGQEPFIHLFYFIARVCARKVASCVHRDTVGTVGLNLRPLTDKLCLRWPSARSG